jgi:hypothetical protein
MAYKDKTELESDNTSDFPTNGNRQITAIILRGWNQDILDSLYLGEYDGTTLVFEPDTLTKIGVHTTNGSTGQDFNVAGTTEMTLEPGLAEIQNDLSVLGSIYTYTGGGTFASSNPDIVDVVSNVDLVANAIYLCHVNQASGAQNQTVMVSTSGSKAITTSELGNSGGSIITWIDNGGALSVQKTGATTPTYRYTIIRLK